MSDILSLSGGHGARPLDVLLELTLIGVAPFIIVMMTSFVRIIVVLSLVRSAIGAPSLPPNIVMTGLALVISVLVMSPTLQTISTTALDPYVKGKIDQKQFVDRATEPLRRFMMRQTRASDLATFMRISHASGREKNAPISVLVPAYVVGELRSAFSIGFALYLPFLAIDLAVAAILMGLGMMMLSPTIVSIPLKLLLFVMVDGWTLVASGLSASFR